MGKILYIAGAGRSGSSILDLYLTHKYAYFSVGEMNAFFKKAIVDKELCSCGKVAEECPFWSKVLDLVGKDSVLNNIEYYAYLESKYNGVHSFFKYFFNIHRSYDKEEFDDFIDINRKLMMSIFKVLGDDYVVIDSSKLAVRALWYNFMSGFDIYVLHLVRQPAGTALSWTRPKIRPELSYKGENVYQARLSYVHGVLRWCSYNLYATFLRFGNNKRKYVYMYYEQFTKNPNIVAKSVNDFLKNDDKDLPSCGYHSIAGNPMRLTRNKDIEIREDKRWKNELGMFKKIMTKLVSCPFGLFIRSGKRLLL